MLPLADRKTEIMLPLADCSINVARIDSCPGHGSMAHRLVIREGYLSIRHQM